jgi:hypothetical protein
MRLTELIFSWLGWCVPFTLKRDGGISDQALLPSASISHNFSGLLALPENLQLSPMMAIGMLAHSPLILPIVFGRVMTQSALKRWYFFTKQRKRLSRMGKGEGRKGYGQLQN